MKPNELNTRKTNGMKLRIVIRLIEKSWLLSCFCISFYWKMVFTFYLKHIEGF